LFCSPLSGRLSWVLCIWCSSSVLQMYSLAFFLTLCCMFHCSPLRNHILITCFSLFVSWIFWLAAAVALTRNLGGTLNCDTQDKFVYCGHLNALEGFAWLILFVFSPYIARQQVDNCLQHSDQSHASFRTYQRHHRAETRRRVYFPHGWSLSEEQKIDRAKENTKADYSFGICCRFIFLSSRQISMPSNPSQLCSVPFSICNCNLIGLIFCFLSIRSLSGILVNSQSKSDVSCYGLPRLAARVYKNIKNNLPP
jgi:hypothetical protein